MKEKILSILTDMHPEFDYAGSDDFIEDGLLSSFDIVDLVDQLETGFGVLIAGVDVVPENFDTTDHIAALVERSGK